MKLRLILIILSLQAFVSAIVGVYFYYSSLKDAAFKEAERQVVTRVEMINNNLSSLLTEYSKPARTLGGTGELKKTLLTKQEYRTSLAAIMELRPLVRNPEIYKREILQAREVRSQKKMETQASVREASSLLDLYKDTLLVDSCFLVDIYGNTIASSNRADPASDFGKNYIFHPFFQKSISGNPSTYLSLDGETGRRYIFFSHPVYDSKGAGPIGIAVIKTSLELAELDLITERGEIILVADPNGIIFFSSKKEWILKSLWKLPPEKLTRIAASQQFGVGPWRWIGWEIGDSNFAVSDSGSQYYTHSVAIDNYPGWNVIHLREIDAISEKISGPLLKITGPMLFSLCFLVGISVFLLYRKAISEIRMRRATEQALHIDITRRKKAEKDLKLAQKQLKHHARNLEQEVKKRTRELGSIFKHTPAVIFMKNRDLEYIMINSRHRELFHLSQEEIKGMKDEEIFPGHIARQFSSSDKKVLETEKPVHVEEHIDFGEEPRSFLTVKFPIYDETNTISGICGISTDMTALKDARDKLERLSRNIISNQEKERAIISRELHDQLGQMLTVLKMDSVWFEKRVSDTDEKAFSRARGMSALIDDTISEIRRMAFRLRPGILDDLGLVEALELLTSDFENHADIACVLEHHHIPDLKNETATAVYRITQEFITNTVRHAGASRVKILLNVRDGHLITDISDDGCGFDANGQGESKGFGIAGMHERASLAGGTLNVTSEKGEGTRVICSIPL